ncbi:MAG: hypothetical protein OEQ53_07455, partial [Saprospiraceae bacterium]|nr:hypothetical protein [Saprospiraceae bacterium]
MKRRGLLLVASLLLTISALAQRSFSGINYQAVARDLSGNVLSAKNLGIKISLLSDVVSGGVVYSETHQITTNEFGLFTLVVGGGNVLSGDFIEVPWSTSEIWVEMAIDQDGGDQYVPVATSMLLAVPYAMHARTADQIANPIIKETEEQRGFLPPGTKSANWHTDGNLETSTTEDFLGTADSTDLIVISNYTERMRVKADGDIEIVLSLAVGQNVDVGQDLTVEKNVSLNTTGGQTTNNGPFTVSSLSPTLLTGQLTVDLATKLKLGLDVFGLTTLHGLFKVDQNFSSLFTGPVTISDLTGSASAATGALAVGGGVGIGQNLNVGGNLAIGGTAAFGGSVSFASAVTIAATDQSTSTSTGALIVGGGVGIGKRLNVGGAGMFESTLGVTGATTLSSTLGVTGATSLGSTLGVTGASTLGSTLGVTGATTLGSTLGVSGATALGGNLDVSGITTLSNTLNLSASVATPSGENPLTGPNHHIANFINTANGNGISIQVGEGTPQNHNNFITFYNSGGGTVGRIEGESDNADFLRNREYQDDIIFKSLGLALTVTNSVIGGFNVVTSAGNVVAAATSATGCVGFGACVTIPIPSLIISSVAEAILTAANLVALLLDVGLVTADLAAFIVTHEALRGITFASGSEDYAEYLPKLNPDEKFLPGDIVGVKNGYITKSTSNADMIMVISHKPIMAGGLPSDEDVSAYGLVAFMGQVPTRIFGKVKPGDYILPGGYHNGFGIGKDPKLMRPKDYKNILGVAWEGNEEMDMGIVNTAIGINSNSLANLVQQQAEKVTELEDQISQTKAILADLVPGFATAANLNTAQYDDGHDHERSDQLSEETLGQYQFVQSSEDQILYFPVEPEYLEEGLKLAEEMA